MPSNPTGIADAAPDAVARGYEARDVNIRAILLLLGGFVVVFTVLCGGLWWMYRHYTGRPITGDAPRSVVDRRTVPSAGPPLQPQPGHDSLDAWDLAKMRQNEDSVFDQLGWKRDERTHRYAVPAEVVAMLKQRAASPANSPATRPQIGGR